jgi:hypothetical protein
MVGREPCASGGERLLAAEELLALVQPIQGIGRTVVRRELQFVEFGPRLGACEGSSKGSVEPPLRLAARGRGRPEEQRPVCRVEMAD